VVVRAAKNPPSRPPQPLRDGPPRADSNEKEKHEPNGAPPAAHKDHEARADRHGDGRSNHRAIGNRERPYGRPRRPGVSITVGNIRCSLARDIDGQPTCEIRDHTWVAPVESITGKPCDFHEGGLSFVLEPGKAASVDCYSGASNFVASDFPTLGYGQTQSLDTITCDSEPSGVTCTDSSTGHFFRLLRDSYQLG
jgi:hypothetical protein